MKTKLASYLSYQNFRNSILGDNQWTLNKSELPIKGCPRFQIHKDDTYVVELKPRDGLRGLLFAPFVSENKHLRVMRGTDTDKMWVKLFTRFQQLGYEIKVTSIQTRRLDSFILKYRFRNACDDIYISYEAYIESKISDPGKFYKYLTFSPDNAVKIQNVIQEELCRYIKGFTDLGNELQRTIEGGTINHPLLEEAGYTINKFTLFFRSEYSQ